MDKVDQEYKTLGRLPESDYQRVASAIDFIERQAQSQPSVDEIAAHLQLSAAHVQRLFSRWAGISPKRFLQVLTLEHAKLALRSADMSVFEAADSLGLSSASRLYDHFVKIEAVTPGEYKNLGKTLSLQWGCAPCPFGWAAIAFNQRGICKLVFCEEHQDQSVRDFLKILSAEWPLAEIQEDQRAAHALIDAVFNEEGVPQGRDSLELAFPLTLMVRGTNFQLAVWRALLALPRGALVSYAHIAQAIGKPKAVRAVASAIGANPVAYLIPCHRVIRQSGALGGYRWGLRRKRALMAFEGAAKAR